jgi:c-di-AMP phosphodiesterase-like protein
MTIAGAQLKGVSLDEALSMLTEAVDEYINNK